MTAEREMPDGYVVRCSGWPTCQYCEPPPSMEPVDIIDRIDELVNWQLKTGRGR